jgi:ABC-type lipoprotein export system ATPase subunit
MSAIDLQDLERHYRTPAGPVLALNGVDLRVDRGQRVAIMGPSGCGKSTLLSVLGALETATSGQVRVLDTNLSGLSDEQRAQWRRENVGFIFQAYDLLPFLTAVENVALQAGVSRQVEADDARDLLDRLGLAAHADKLPDQLSGGQKQRVGIARCLVHRPRLILADEPTGGLDSVTSAHVIQELLALIDDIGATAVIVTHDPTVAAAFDDVVNLLDGRIVTVKPLHRKAGHRV